MDKTAFRYFVASTLGFLLITLTYAQTAPHPPFSRGVNLASWFEQSSVRTVQFTRFDKSDFQNIKSLGADVIRLPIKLHDMTSGAPDFRVDPLFFQFMDQVVSWAEELKIYLILDNHTFDSAKPTDPDIEKALLKVWPQVAKHYRDRSAYILYEVLNEPHGIDLGKWARIQGNVIQAIRAVDTVHTIVVGPANWNNYRDLNSLPTYADKNLIYTFHFYDPFLFTHQGANWTDLEPVSGIRFPADKATMPEPPASLRGSWVGKNWYNYLREGTPAAVKQLIDIPADFARQRQVPIYCGEFGVYMLRSDPTDRADWYKLVREYLESQHIAWTSWDYFGGFGLFQTQAGGVFPQDLNRPLVQAMGFQVPPEQANTSLPETSALDLFRGYTSRGLTNWQYNEAGTLDFYDSLSPVAGKFSIHWHNAPRYNTVAFDFNRIRDFSQLFAQGFAIELDARGLGQPATIELRLVNPGDGADALPWRLATPLNIPPDGNWHHLRIPLADLRETGAWKQKWYPGNGQFDRKKIQRLEFVSEISDLRGRDFWLSEIRIVP